MSKVRVHSFYVVGFSHLRWGFDDVPLALHTPSGLSLAVAKVKSTNTFTERVSTSEQQKLKFKAYPPDYMLYLLIGCDYLSFARCEWGFCVFLEKLLKSQNKGMVAIQYCFGQYRHMESHLICNLEIIFR